MAIKLGYISTEKNYESIKPYSSKMGFENVGFINAQDLAKNSSFDSSQAEEFANRVDAVVLNQTLEKEELLPLLLRKGKHILVLDGVQSIFKQGRKLEQLLHEGGNVFQLNCFTRTKPVYTALRQYLKKPKYAKIERWTQQKGDLFELLANDVDMILSCFQSSVKDVICHSSYIFQEENVDLLSLKLLFHNGGSADILIHGASSEMGCNGLFIDQNAYYKVDFMDQQIVEVESHTSEQLSLLDEPSETGSSALVQREKKILAFDYLQKAFRNFEENIAYGFTPLVNVTDAKNVGEVLQKTEYIMQRNCVNWT